jgi:hypothetical protein
MKCIHGCRFSSLSISEALSAPQTTSINEQQNLSQTALSRPLTNNEIAASALPSLAANFSP